MSNPTIDKSNIMASLSYYCGMKGFRFGEPDSVLKIISQWADKFIEKNKNEKFYYYSDCHQALCKFARYKMQNHTTSEIEYKCPRCKNPTILWQFNYISQVKCPECHYIFEEDRAYKILDEVVQVESRVELNPRPAGLHIRTKRNPYLLARKALSRLNNIKEKDYGTVKNPYEDMSCELRPNKSGVYELHGYSSGPTKTLAQALYDRETIDYHDGWTIIDYSGDVLYVDLTITAWEENHPYYEPIIIGNVR